MTALPTLGGNNAIGYALNERGQLVGTSEKAAADPRCPAPQRLPYVPVMWDLNVGGIRELALPVGDTTGFAYNVNDRGEAVGGSGTCDTTSVTAADGLFNSTRAVLWENGVPRDLGNFGVAASTTAVGLNNRTEVVGASPLPNEAGMQGFLWSREHGLEPISGVGEDPVSLPSSINNARQVVGASCDAVFNCRAYVWERYQMLDLNDAVAGDSPIYMVFPTWINDVGEIAGWGFDKRTEEIRGFLLRPVKAQPGTASKAERVRAAQPMEVRTRARQSIRFGRR